MGKEKALHAIAKLAKAEHMSEGFGNDGVMSARLDESGRMQINAATRAAEVEAMLSGNKLEQTAEELGFDEDMSDDELDERTEALQNLIRSKMRWEREQIVKVVEQYARDCDDRCQELIDGAKTMRKKYRKENLPELGDKALEEAHRRASAFKVRSAIALDLAEKIAQGWGRTQDGTPQ